MDYPKHRHLDGVYFHVCRNGNYEDICFTDLTKKEQENVMLGKSRQWLYRMTLILANALRCAGDKLDLQFRED